MAISTITVHAALAPDETFTAPTQAAVGEIYWFHMLPDGKILAGGEKLFRLNADGTLDPTYPVISYPGGFMRQPALEPDGGIVVHGVYYDPTGERSFDGLIRYHADGTEDETFRPVFGGYDQVHHLARDSAGRYIIGGTFPSHGDAALIRLNHDGSFDIGFDLGEFAVNGLATLPNGQTLVAGALLENRYFKESALVRLSSTGRVLQMTHPGTIGTLTVDRQGRILFSGQFASVLGRLTPKGVADKTFNPLFGEGPADPRSDSIVPLPDGRIIAGGYFGEYVTHSSEWPLSGADSWKQSSLVRVFPDGTVDESFDVDGSGIEMLYVKDIAVQPGNKLLVLDSYGLRRFIETPEPAIVTFATDELRVNESERYANIPVYRMGLMSTTAQAYFMTIPGSARPNADFRFLSQRIVFNPGEWRKMIVVRLVDDLSVEPVETFRGHLSDWYGPGRHMIRPHSFGRQQITVHITDNDPAGN